MKGSFRKSMRWFHNCLGLIFGWILFFIFLTGTLGYFDSEIDRWMRPELPMKFEKFSEEELSSMAIKHLSENASDSTKWVIYLPNYRENVLKIKWYQPTRFATSFRPAHGSKRGFAEYIDPNTNSIVKVRETGGGQILYKMHYRLHYVSRNTGRILVGLASMAMLVALLTGIIIHINIFKGFFTFTQDKSVRSWFDGHLLTGVIALPFHLMITYSGLLFFVFFYVTFIPLANYGKEMRSIITEVFPSQKAVKINHKPASLIDIKFIVNDAKKDFEYIKSITIVNPNDSSAQVEVKREYTTLLKGNKVDKIYYDGLTGKRIEKPNLNKPSSNTFRSIMTGLHVGLFADDFFRWIYFISGLLGTFMISTGLVLWTKKREYKQKDTFSFKLVDSLNAGTIVGLCSAIGAYFIANRVIDVNSTSRITQEVDTMFLVWLITFIIAFLSKRKYLWQIQFIIASIIYFSIPIINFIFTDKDIISTINHGDIMLISFDSFLIFVGVVFAYLALKKGKEK